MITRRPVAAAMAALCFAPVATRASAQEPGITGTWTGVLVAGQAKLRLRLVLAADGVVKLYSLDQGGVSMSGTAVSTKPDQIAVEIPAVGGRFAGKLTSADRLEGTWSQGGSDFPLMMMRGEAGLPKPPTRVAPPPPAALTQALLEQLRQASGSPALGAAAQRKGGKTLAWVTGHRRVGTGELNRFFSERGIKLGRRPDTRLLDSDLYRHHCRENLRTRRPAVARLQARCSGPA